MPAEPQRPPARSASPGPHGPDAGSPPLDGVTVLDLSRVLAGPYCSMILGDLGADVIKVEHPDGDDTRRWGPPFAAGESAYFLAVNRNKRSVVADLTSADGTALVRRIARQADVLIENFRPGTLERFGLPLAKLREANPRLVTLTISGMGATGPERDRPGYDFVLQAVGGLMSITGPEDGPPSKVGVAVVDLTTGMMATNAVLAALLARERTRRGQHVDISLLETQAAWLANVASAYLLTREPPTRHGNGHPHIVPYQTFRAADRDFAVGVGNETQWQRFCQEIDRPELAEDPRFRTNSDRIKQRAALTAILHAHFGTRHADEWLERLRTAGVPCGPVRTVPEVLDGPQLSARDMIVTVDHPSIGELRLVGIPFKFSDTAASIRRPPPLLGQHTAEVRAEYPVS